LGKGDIKTRRGKITNKSYGSRRPKKRKKVAIVAKKTTKAKAKTTAKKTAAKKTAKKD
jgi:30S ribosomal protein S31